MHHHTVVGGVFTEFTPWAIAIVMLFKWMGHNVLYGCLKHIWFIVILCHAISKTFAQVGNHSHGEGWASWKVFLWFAFVKLWKWRSFGVYHIRLLFNVIRIFFPYVRLSGGVIIPSVNMKFEFGLSCPLKQVHSSIRLHALGWATIFFFTAIMCWLLALFGRAVTNSTQLASSVKIKYSASKRANYCSIPSGWTVSSISSLLGHC